MRTVLLLLVVTAVYTPLYAGSETVVVAVTVPYLEPVVRAIGGERVEVLTLVPLGVDPHHYEPPLSVLLDLVRRARLVIMTGPSHLPIEERLEELVSEGYLAIRIVDYRNYLSAGLQLLRNPLTGELNPHEYAFTLSGLKVIARALCDALSEVDSGWSGYYEENFRKYLQYLDSLARALNKTSERLRGTRVALLTPVLQYVVVELGLELGYLVLPGHGLQIEAPRALDAANSYRKLYDVLLISDLELAEYGDLISQLESRGVAVAVVPLSKLVNSSPELVPLATLINLMSYRGSAEARQGGGDHLTTALVAVLALVSGVALGYVVRVVSPGRRR